MAHKNGNIRATRPETGAFHLASMDHETMENLLQILRELHRKYGGEGARAGELQQLVVRLTSTMWRRSVNRRDHDVGAANVIRQALVATRLLLKHDKKKSYRVNVQHSWVREHLPDLAASPTTDAPAHDVTHAA